VTILQRGYNWGKERREAMTIETDIEEIHIRRCGPVEGRAVEREGTVTAWVNIGGIEFRRWEGLESISDALEVVNSGVFDAVSWLKLAYGELPEDCLAKIKEAVK
jgi:sugar lactone lactonase YvrE